MNNLYSRFEPKDTGLFKAIKALIQPKQADPIEEYLPYVESFPTIEENPDVEIDGLLAEAVDIAANNGLRLKVSLHYSACCRSCREDFDLDIDSIAEFDSSMSFCGRTQHCLP